MLDAEYRPPVKRGDLEDLAGFDTVVIIDGQFGQSLSVTPKEILALIDSGVSVVGASSMGALRAAELDSFGMKGVGWVYRRFKQTWIRQEDEVALSYAAHDFSALTVPLVDCAFWLDRLAKKRLVSQPERRVLFNALKRVFFADRTEEVVVEVVTAIIGGVRFDALSDHRAIPDIKKADARDALAFVADTTGAAEPVIAAAF